MIAFFWIGVCGIVVGVFFLIGQFLSLVDWLTDRSSDER